MAVVNTKVLALFLLTAIKLVAGLAPLYITDWLRKVNTRLLDKLIGVVLCVGGGVLLSTVFVHILPEVRESLARAAHLGVSTGDDYPAAEVLICSGFLLILLVEAVVHKCCGHSHDKPKADVVQLDMKDDTCADEHGVNNNVKEEIVNNKVNNNEIRVRSDCRPVCSTPKPCTFTPQLAAFNPKLPLNKGLKSQMSKLQDMSAFNDSSASIIASMKPAKLKEMMANMNMKDMMANMKVEKRLVSSLRSFLVVVALSVHSVFEGMAVGLQETEAGVWKLFLAIAIHATAILFCIGMEMVATGSKKVEIVTYMGVLSLVTPIGIVIGILVTETVEEASGTHVLVMAVLQGLAGGTLLYITFFEVLDRDKLKKYGMAGLVGVMAVVLGFAFMASMEGLGGHSHGGGGHHGHSHEEVGHYEHSHGGGEHHKQIHEGGEQHEQNPEEGRHQEHSHEEEKRLENHNFDSDHENNFHDKNIEDKNYWNNKYGNKSNDSDSQINHQYLDGKDKPFHSKEDNHHHHHHHHHGKKIHHSKTDQSHTNNFMDDENFEKTTHDYIHYDGEDTENNGTSVSSRILSVLTNQTAH